MINYLQRWKREALHILSTCCTGTVPLSTVGYSIDRVYHRMFTDAFTICVFSNEVRSIRNFIGAIVNIRWTQRSLKFDNPHASVIIYFKDSHSVTPTPIRPSHHSFAYLRRQDPPLPTHAHVYQCSNLTIIYDIKVDVWNVNPLWLVVTVFT